MNEEKYMLSFFSDSINKKIPVKSACILTLMKCLCKLGTTRDTTKFYILILV